MSDTTKNEARIAELENEQKAWRVFTDKANQTCGRLEEHIAKLEAFVAAYDTLSGAIHSGDNYRIARAIAATDEARQVLKESNE